MADTWTHSIVRDPAQATYWDAQSRYSDTVMQDSVVDPGPGVDEVQLVFTRTSPAGVTDDVMVTHLAFSKRVAMGAVSTLLSADKAAIEGYLNTWWTATKIYVTSGYTLKEYRWHTYPKPGVKPGPANRITSVNVAGTGIATVRLPDQNAVTVTFRTASRKHWGRMYLPGLNASNYDGYGRIIPSVVDGIAAAARTLLNSAEGATTPVWVVSHAHPAILAVSEMAVDSTGDIVRRRRAKHTSYWKVYTS